MNRAERRQRSRRSERREMRELRSKRRPPQVLQVYNLAGQLLTVNNLPQGERVPDQMRVVRAEDGFASVTQAEAAGRLDLIRCFMRDPFAPGPGHVYREVEGGQDRLPAGERTHEGRMHPDLSAYPEVEVRARAILELFPAGEIWPFEANLLAFYDVEGARRERSGETVSAESIEEPTLKFIRDAGYGELWSWERMRRSFAVLPALRRRLFELELLRCEVQLLAIARARMIAALAERQRMLLETLH